MAESAAQSDQTGNPQDGAADVAGQDGQSDPVPLATPPEPPTAPPKTMPVEKVDRIVAKAREQAKRASLNELLARYEVENEDELSMLLEEGKRLHPKPKDKALADLEAKLAEKERELAVKNTRLEEAAIERAVYPHLKDAFDPDLFLLKLKKETGQSPYLREDGTVGVMDTRDKEPLEESLEEWIRNNKGRAKQYLKPTVEAAQSAVKIVKTKTEADAERRQEEQRAGDQRYRTQELTKAISGLRRS